MLTSVIYFVGGLAGLIVLILLFLTSRYYKIRHEGEALIINGTKQTRATLTGAFVWPVINRCEFMDITRKKISVVRSGRKDQVGEESEGLHCRDNIRADLKVDFYIGVNHEEEDIVRVAKLFTTHGASQIAGLKEHFQPKFSEALKTAVKQFEFEELLTNRREFRDAVVEVIGSEMDGFKIYDVVIDRVDQTSFDAHDPQNVLDVEGIRKIASITSSKNIETNAIRQDEQTLIKQKNVEAESNRAQLDKQEQENLTRVKREIEIIRAQEDALTEEKRQEYISQKELARLQTEENVAKRQESMQMEVELTRSSNERQVAIQQEEVNRAKETERVRTERDIAQQNMEMEAALEESRKLVVETRSQRVEIERKIAREEEETANLRAFQLVEREKKVRLVEAEAAAEAEGIRSVVLARTEKQAAQEWMEKKTLENEANIKISTREAENELNVKTRQAEAALIQETKRAEGKERMAHATREEISAEGLAQVGVDRERAMAIRETGDAEASAISSLGLAEAESHRAKGEAQAQALRAKGLAEAETQTARFEAAKQFDEQTRDHDKWVLELQQEKELEIARIDAHRSMSVDNAKALATALSNADIKLFGGQGMEELRTTIMSSARLDSRIDNSEVLKPLVREYTEEGRSLSDDIRAVLENSKIDTGTVSNLALANFLTQLNGNGNLQQKLQQLVSGNSAQE